MAPSPMYGSTQQQPIVTMRQNSVPGGMSMQQAQQLPPQQQQQQRMMGSVMSGGNGNSPMPGTPLSSTSGQRRIMDGSNIPGTPQMPMQHQINAQGYIF